MGQTKEIQFIEFPWSDRSEGRGKNIITYNIYHIYHCRLGLTLVTGWGTLTYQDQVRPP